MRTLYLRPALAHLWPDCAVLHVGPLLRELIVEIVRIGQLRTRNRIERALRDLLIAELKRATPVPTLVMLPTDYRALAVAQKVIANPADCTPLKSICRSAGISVRTLERVFRKEVGTDFQYWRRQMRLMKAIELLVAGQRVKEVAFSVGYKHPSAFLALFRATFGTTPKAWTSRYARIADSR
jgi:transcriptional regulator GlxA family with amidase domain